MPSLDYRAASTPSHQRQLHKALFLIVVSVACDLLAVVSSVSAWGCWGFVLSGGTTHGAGDFLIPILGLVTTGSAFIFLVGSALAAAYIPREAGEAWRPVAWTLFSVSLLIFLGAFGRGLMLL